MFSHAAEVCRADNVGIAIVHSGWSPMMPLLMVVAGFSSVALIRAAHREGELTDLGYGGYISDALRACALFCAAAAVCSMGAILEPCLFLIDNPPLFIGLMYWLALFVAIAFYGGWSLRRNQARNALISKALRHNCRNFEPPHGEDSHA